ncbi:hypothetical protein GW931_02015 [archaeon]|nr:hypothetical protein [archaeon]
MNKQVVFNSVLALIFLYLSFKIDWIFIVGSVVLMYINQRMLFKGRLPKKK